MQMAMAQPALEDLGKTAGILCQQWHDRVLQLLGRTQDGAENLWEAKEHSRGVDRDCHPTCLRTVPLPSICETVILEQTSNMAQVKVQHLLLRFHVGAKGDIDLKGCCKHSSSLSEWNKSCLPLEFESQSVKTRNQSTGTTSCLGLNCTSFLFP